MIDGRTFIWMLGAPGKRTLNEPEDPEQSRTVVDGTGQLKEKRVPMAFLATDEPTFCLRFVLIASCAHVQ